MQLCMLLKAFSRDDAFSCCKSFRGDSGESLLFACAPSFQSKALTENGLKTPLRVAMNNSDVS